MNKRHLEKLLERLPETNPIQGRERYFNCAVIIPLVKFDQDYHLLFEVRAKAVRQEGEICFPGGGYNGDIDTGYAATAIRETCEELGIESDRIEIKGKMGTLVTPLGIAIEPFVATLNIGCLDELKLNKKEVAEIFTVPIDVFSRQKPHEYQLDIRIAPYRVEKDNTKRVLFPAKSLGIPDRYSEPWYGRGHRVLVYQIDGRVIWGLTAELTHNLIATWPIDTPHGKRDA